MSARRRRPSLWEEGLALLGRAVPLFRPGTSLPGAHAPYLGAPRPTQGLVRAAPAGLLRRSLALSSAEGALAEVVVSCAGGAVQTGWALHLGASPLVIAMLAALPFLGQVLQLPAAYLSAHLGARRVALWANGLSRQALLPLVVLPFLPLGRPAQQQVLFAVVAVSSLLGVVGNNAWVTWMGETVPRRVRGRYFARRTAAATLTGALAALGAGFLLDGAGGATMDHGLALLALLACAAGGASTLLMRRQHGPPPQPPRAIDWAAALAPFRSGPARRFLGYQVLWNAAIGLSAAYFAVFMLRDLALGFTLVALYGAAVAAVRVVSGPLWGRAVDRLGSRPVLLACSFGIAVIPLYWALARPDFRWPILLDVALSGVLWTGHGLAVFSLPLAVAPERGRSFYLASFATAGGVAYALAAFVGGALVPLLPRHLEVGGLPLVDLQVLFVASAGLRLLAALVGLRIEEAGAHPVGALLRAVRAGGFSPARRG